MSPLYKKTISRSIPTFMCPTNPSLLVRNASLINLFNLLRWVAFRISLVTAKPTRTRVLFEGVECTKATNGFLSYFLPRVITLVKDPNPRRFSIDGWTRGKNAPTFWQVFFLYLSLLTESFFLPAARRRLITFRPFFVAIRARNPWVFFLFLLCG